MPTAKKRKKSTARPSFAKRSRSRARTPDALRDDELRPIKTRSMTSIASEALRTGISPYTKLDESSEIPGERKIKAGDVDVDELSNEYSGEEIPGGTTPTPDQTDIDDIGKAYGLSEEDSGELRTSSEILERRDRRMHNVKKRNLEKHPRGFEQDLGR